MIAVGRNKRRYPRCRMSAYAWLQPNHAEPGHPTTTHNLSCEGAMFSDLRPVKVGEPMLLSLYLGQGHPPLECRAQVCWMRLMPNGLYHYGVRFIDLKDGEIHRINETVQALKAQNVTQAV